jgi:hypothetical protein
VTAVPQKNDGASATSDRSSVEGNFVAERPLKRRKRAPQQASSLPFRHGGGRVALQNAAVPARAEVGRSGPFGDEAAINVTPDAMHHAPFVEGIREPTDHR